MAAKARTTSAKKQFDKMTETMMDAVDEALKKALDSVGVATKEDIKAIEMRLSKLEGKKRAPARKKKAPAKKKKAPARKKKAPAKKKKAPARKKKAPAKKSAAKKK